MAASNKDQSPPPDEELDHYRLLQLDPDAPQELIVEAYWHFAEKLRAQQDIGEGVYRELEGLNLAYTQLVVPERRQAYDAGLERVLQIRRGRDRLRAMRRKRPLLARILAPERDVQPKPMLDGYALLCVDPAADTPLIELAYRILRSLDLEPEDEALRSRKELREAYETLIDEERRAAYDAALAKGRQHPEPSTELKPQAKRQSRPRKERKPRAARPVTGTLSQAQPIEKEKKHRDSEEGSLFRSLGTAVAGAARLTGRSAMRSGHLVGKGSVWAVRRVRRDMVAAGRGLAQMREDYREWRAEARAEADDVILEQRVLRDTIPPAFRPDGEKPLEKPCRARLEVVESSGKRYGVALEEKAVTLGSGRDCEVPLDPEQGTVADAHTQIWCTGGRYIVRSLSSRCPTIVNGSTVNWALLDDGDEIEIGRHHIRFQLVGRKGQVPDYLSAREGMH